MFEEVHESYRETVRRFIQEEVTPNLDRWEADETIDASFYLAAIKAGIYGLGIPEEFGGPGVTDYRFRVVVAQEFARARATAVGLSLATQDDMFLHYLDDLATDEQLARWMPRIASGELIGATAMTEPGAGSDLRGMTTTATRDGDDWILNGSKTFITHGIRADLVLVAARTGDRFSLFMLERGMPGFERGRQLKKLGLHVQDTGELFFHDVRVPAANLLGTENDGLRQLMAHLERERLVSTVSVTADMRAVYDLTVDYVVQRKAFGQTVADFQVNRFKLAEMETEIELAEALVERQTLAMNSGTLDAVAAAKGKWWTTELQKKVIDTCVQLHGGYGYMLEYPVTRAFADARIQTIYGGTTEIMKDLISKRIVKTAKQRLGV